MQLQLSTSSNVCGAPHPAPRRPLPHSLRLSARPGPSGGIEQLIPEPGLGAWQFYQHLQNCSQQSGTGQGSNLASMESQPPQNELLSPFATGAGPPSSACASSNAQSPHQQQNQSQVRLLLVYLQFVCCIGNLLGSICKFYRAPVSLFSKFTVLQ